MAFWGVEIKPGKPFSHKFDRSRGRLHISQATLGIGISVKKSLVQCNVGDKSPILLCSLMPDKNESCPLDLEFEEVDEVIFSVLGPRSVHLTGYYLGDDGLTCGHDHDDDSDSYGEDIQESESEDNSDYDEEDDEDEYEDDFIDDDDIEMFCPPKKNSGVVIEEILDDEKPANGNGNRKRLKKKCQISDSDDDNQQKIVVRGSTGMSESESEDEDGLPVSQSKKGAADKTAEVEDKSVKKAANGTKKSADVDERHTGSKRKIANVESERTVEELKGLSENDEEPKNKKNKDEEVQPENNEEPKKKKKKKSKKGKSPRDGNKPDAQNEDAAQVGQAKTDHMDQDHHVREGDEEQPTDNSAKNNAGEDHTDAGKKKKKKKKNKNKTSDSDKNVNTEEKGSTGEKESAVADKKGEKKSGYARCFDNGLLVEDIAMGKPDGKRASPGNKIFVCYTGKLKKNGQIFDSNVGGPPFKFRLGIGEVIKAWDVGCNGMRIGDKRRITVPPSMGYGSGGAPPHIPPNAWLVFEVELVDVRK